MVNLKQLWWAKILPVHFVERINELTQGLDSKLVDVVDFFSTNRW